MKNLKPIDIDLHFKYRCPNNNCGIYHWLSLKETKTKNFKVVCECSQVFKPKMIKKIKITYAKPVKIKRDYSGTTHTTPSQELVTETETILLHNGFTESEAKCLVLKAYNLTLINDKILLAKYILSNIGALENYDQKTIDIR